MKTWLNVELCTQKLFYVFLDISGMKGKEIAETLYILDS